MDKNTMTCFIDRKIEKWLSEGRSIPSIQVELGEKVSSFMEKLQEEEIDIISLFLIDPERIINAQIKWRVLYVRQCIYRLKNLDWLVNNRYKFTHLSDNKLFSLVKFREKLLDTTTELPF